MIDFANSFIYKANTPTAMATPSGTTYADVVASETCVGGAAGTPKPTAGGSGNTDSDLTGAFSWDIPFACATASQTATDAAGNKILQYDLFWNSQFSDANNVMYQLGQVQISCKVNPYQEDAGVVTVTEDAAVADISDKYVDVAGGLELKVNSVSLFETRKQFKLSPSLPLTAPHSMKALSHQHRLPLAPLSPTLLMPVLLRLVTTWNSKLQRCQALVYLPPLSKKIRIQHIL